MDLNKVQRFLSNHCDCLLEFSQFSESRNWSLNCDPTKTDEGSNEKVDALLIAIMHLHNQLVSEYLSEVKKQAEAGSLNLDEYVISKKDKRLQQKTSLRQREIKPKKWTTKDDERLVAKLLLQAVSDLFGDD